ncbi:MAG TPA: D-aminoacyl-tRNA deacylase [Bryobacteraceae bacterium]|nr:D-aminoacyl-tRNA deacylase [Bryobacteraceae bacterium]
MRFLVQRVTQASVTVSGQVTGSIGKGLLVLVGVHSNDSESIAEAMLDKLINLRIFPDSDNKMNLSALQTGAALLLVSQFTLYGDCRKGRRPSFAHAATPEQAQDLYNLLVTAARGTGLEIQTGAFREHMDVALVNDGPITLMLDSAELFPVR